MSGTIRVRMYNVGFGDCFLLTLPGKRTLLVDAGFHSQGKGAFDGNALVEQVAKDVKAISGETRIDVVVATHRHQDHVYAFNSEKWNDVAVGEVWLPWVEDRSNTKATKLWKKKNSFAQMLFAAMPSFGLGPDDRAAVEFMLWNAGVNQPGMAGFDAGGWSNEKALDCLHDGFASRDRAKPRFLPETQTFPEAFESPALPGVRVHVLGPPRNPELIEELDPEDDGETYRALALRAAAGGPLDVAGVACPFGDPWQVPDGEDPQGFRLDPSEIERIDELAHGADAVFAATKLDGMINSTSLVLVLQIGTARLVLPGDAEWGTWKRIVKPEEAQEARALLSRASFLKVGHHGSHNATAKSLVEKILPHKIPAMISTQQGPGTYRNNIPLQELLDAFDANEIHFARSDRQDGALPAGFQKGAAKKWIDLELPC
jgi:beta-lactamase superfamily II metal-dependent hydrolase